MGRTNKSVGYPLIDALWPNKRPALKSDPFVWNPLRLVETRQFFFYFFFGSGCVVASLWKVGTEDQYVPCFFFKRIAEVRGTADKAIPWCELGTKKEDPLTFMRHSHTHIHTHAWRSRHFRFRLMLSEGAASLVQSSPCQCLAISILARLFTGSDILCAIRRWERGRLYKCNI